jgi:hypothetical protein
MYFYNFISETRLLDLKNEEFLLLIVISSSLLRYVLNVLKTEIFWLNFLIQI